MSIYSNEENGPIDVWLKFDHPLEDCDDDMASHEANTYMTDTGYRIEWYLNAVGQVTTVYFDTLADAYDWYEREGFQDYSSGGDD